MKIYQFKELPKARFLEGEEAKKLPNLEGRSIITFPMNLGTTKEPKDGYQQMYVFTQEELTMLVDQLRTEWATEFKIITDLKDKLSPLAELMQALNSMKEEMNTNMENYSQHQAQKLAEISRLLDCIIEEKEERTAGMKDIILSAIDAHSKEIQSLRQEIQELNNPKQ